MVDIRFWLNRHAWHCLVFPPSSLKITSWNDVWQQMVQILMTKKRRMLCHHCLHCFISAFYVYYTVLTSKLNGLLKLNKLDQLSLFIITYYNDTTVPEHTGVFHCRGTDVLLLWIIGVSYVLCLSCFRVCSLLPCGHLLGKGWPLGSCLWC